MFHLQVTVTDPQRENVHLDFDDQSSLLRGKREVHKGHSNPEGDIVSVQMQSGGKLLEKLCILFSFQEKKKKTQTKTRKADKTVAITLANMA